MAKAMLSPLGVAGLLLFTALGFAACGNSKAPASDAGASGGRPGGAPGVANTPQVFAVNTTTAVQGAISDYIALAGDIVSGSSVDAYSDMTGKITKLYVSVGSQVTKDMPIAEVDPSSPGRTFIPSVAKSPISGTIVSLTAQLGMTVSPALSLARIAGGNGLEIKVYVAERFISKMTEKLPCEIILDAWPGETFRGSITELSPVVDPASRTMEVKINVENPGSKLKAGMFVKVRIITEAKEDIVKIPYAALVSRFGETYVFTVETDPSDPAFKVARRRVITPGILVDGVQEVQKGLSPREEIIVKGQSLLSDGSRVNVVERIAPLSAAQ
jgi:multidrug efflux pump subunit AcrA (membrane-fusion protein)